MGLQSFFDGVRRAAVQVLGLGGNRLELFGIEWREEIERQTGHLIWLLAAFVFAGLALLLLSLLLLIIFWDTHRVAVALALLLLYGSFSVLCVLNLRRRIRLAPAPFAVTVEEFRRDRAALLRKNGEDA